MQKTLLIAMLSLAAITTQAQQQQWTRQQNWKPFFGGRKTNPMTLQILQSGHQQPALKGTALTERLIGWSIYQGTVVGDSARYKYNSFSRGSNLDNIVLSSYQDEGFDPINTYQQPYPMGINRGMPTVLFDSAYVMFAISTGGTDKYESWLKRSYSTNTVFLETVKSNVHYQGVDYPSNELRHFSYDPTGANLNNTQYDDDTSAAQNGSFAGTTKMLSTYTAGKVTTDSIIDLSSGVAMGTEYRTYAYDPSGNMTGSVHYAINGTTWAADQQDFYKYNSSNKLTTHLGQYFDGISMVNDVTDTFGYTGNNVVYESYYEWDDNVGAWSNGSVTKSYYNAQNNIDSQINLAVSGNGLSPSFKIRMNYTALGHISFMDLYEFLGTDWSTTATARFNMFYQTYDPTGVATVKAAELGASIYPTPASDVLNIRFKTAPKSATNVRIYNTAGQLLQNAILQSGSYQVPVSNLVPGNYIVDITGAEGVQHLQFVKL